MQFHGAIEGKWHIYDLGPYDGGPNPTVLKIEEVAGIKLVGTPYIKSDVHKAFDEMFNMEIGTCENGVVLAQKVEVSSASPVTLTANIEWQACDNGSCLPPADEDVMVKLPAAVGVAATEPAKNEEAAPAENAQPAAVVEEVAPASEVAPVAEEEGKSLWGVILEAIAWGFVALLTPVYHKFVIYKTKKQNLILQLL